MENFNISNWKKDFLLKEEAEPKKETIFVLLDTFQDEEAIFTGASKTKEGIEALKQAVMDRHNITDPEEIAQLHIYEVPLDTYFEKRKEADDAIKSSFD
jgi:selenocysteine-specific translation elongation factor